MGSNANHVISFLKNGHDGERSNTGCTLLGSQQAMAEELSSSKGLGLVSSHALGPGHHSGHVVQKYASPNIPQMQLLL
jgi:hypothetical protein